MFGFGLSRKGSRDDQLFGEPNVRELVASFPYKTSLVDGESDPNELFPLASGKGFIGRAAVSRLFQKKLDENDGRLSAINLADELDISLEQLLRLVREDEVVVLSRDGRLILTHSELERISEELRRKAENSFVSTNAFAEENKIESKNLIKLVDLDEQKTVESPLQLLQDPRNSTMPSDSSSYPYIHTLTMLLKTKQMLSEKIKSAQEEAKPVSWTSSEMHGLAKKAFCRLAESLISHPNQPDPMQGDFESNEDGVRFVPNTYILRKVKYHVKEVAHGHKPFCDLKYLTKLYHKLLPDVQSAKELVETASHEKDGSPSKFHFVSHYAIGDYPLNNTARASLEKMGDDRYIYTKPYLRAFPKEIHDDVRVLLHNRIELWFRANGANGGDMIAVGDWVIIAALVDDLVVASKRIGKTMAEEDWKAQPEKPTSSPTLPTKSFLERLQEESETPLELLQQLWENKTECKISSAANIAFDTRLTELHAESQDQFVTLWRSRVILKSSLYNLGLDSLPLSPLRDQLTDLLSTYLSQDVIPNTIKRARTKGMIRTPHLTKQLSKFETLLSPEKKDKEKSPLDALTKFSKKLGLSNPTSAELAMAKGEHLADMLAAMQKDNDPPRVFLSLIIILVATKREGVVYATGKFAPKLLKTLKGELKDGVYERVEEIKELVKQGKSGKAEMRGIARNVLDEWGKGDGHAGEQKGFEVDGKTDDPETVKPGGESKAETEEQAVATPE